MCEKNGHFLIETKLSNITDDLRLRNETAGQMSTELSEITSTPTEESETCETIIIEEVSSLAKFSKTSTKNGVIKFETTNCENLSGALNIIRSSNFDEVISKPCNVYLVKFRIFEELEELNASELTELNEKFMNRSVVIVFGSRCKDKISIYWKSKDLDYFLMIKPHTDTFSIDDVEVYDFMSNFLEDSLQNGHLGLDKKCQLDEKAYRIEIFNISDLRGYNLLLLACESGKVNVAVTLLKIGLDLADEEQNTNLQDIALKNGHFDVILALYKENVPLPAPDYLDSCSEEFKIFAKRLEEFNAMIVEDNLEKVKEIFEQLPRTSYFYNFTNESALKVATENRSFKSYDFLVSEKLLFAPHESPEDYYDEMDYDDQRVVREIHNKYTQELQEKHINVLLSKSFLSHDVPDARKRLKSVHRAYEALNTNTFIKIILMIVAASKNFKIIFDFNRDSVNFADPTATSNTQGLFYLSGRIYIGAKQLLNEVTAHETLATIAHELCHFAVNLVYNNDAKPYKANDNITMQEFEEISKTCEARMEKEDVIGLVYGCYPTDMHHAELIVRVVHLLAFYRSQPEKLTEVRDNFDCLFDFYEKRIVPEMREALPEIDGRAEKEIQRKDKKISKFKKISIIFGVLSVLGIIGAVFVGFIFHKPTYSFNKLSKVDQMKVQNASVNYKNVPIHFQDLFPSNSLAYDKLTSDHISQMLEGRSLNFTDPFVHYLDELVTHKWENMSANLKNKFLNSNFTFQNEGLKFEKLQEVSPKAFNFLTSEQIKDVLNGHNEIIDKMLSNRTEFIVERTFLNDNAFEVYFDFLSKILSTQSNDYEGEDKAESKNSEEKFKKFYENFEGQNGTSYIQNINEIKANPTFNWMLANQFEHFFLVLFSFTTLQESFDDVLEESENSKMFVLSSEAGTGKTTTFEQYTIRIKKMFPTRWVSYIDLKDHTQLYNKNESLGNIEGLLENIFDLNSKSEFERKVFNELFDSGEVVLLWNGFDEISPTYSEFILNVLNFVHQNTSNVQFVCTRPLYKAQLWERFHISSRVLIPFDKEKQGEFLRKFFISKKIPEDKIPDYITKSYKIIDALKRKATADETREDINTPLMLEMVADLISNEIEIYEYENLYQIYLKFVKRKIKIWNNKSGFASEFAENSYTDYRKFDMMQMYQMYALKSEYYFESVEFKIMNQNIPKELTSEEISRMGILYINGDSFKFAHKTFAEFFVAQFLIENIYSVDIASEDSQKILQLFFDIAMKYEFTNVLKNFVKPFLETQNSHENENFDPKIADIIRTKNDRFLFDQFLLGDPESFEFLFNFFKKDHKLLVDILHVNDNETFYTASFNPAYFRTSGLKPNHTHLMNLGKEHLTNDEYEKFIIGKNQKGIILFSMYLYDSSDVSSNIRLYDLSEETLKNQDKSAVFESITKNLTKSELKELLLSTSSPVTWSEIDLIEKQSIIQNFFDDNSDFAYEIPQNEDGSPAFNLEAEIELQKLFTSSPSPSTGPESIDKQNLVFWNIVNASLTPQEQVEMISNFFYGISLTYQHQNLLELLVAKSEEILSNTDIFEIFLNNRIIHTAASTSSKTFEDLWMFFVRHTNEKQQKDMLKREVDGICFDLFDIPYPKKLCYRYPPFNILHILLSFLREGEIDKVSYSTEFYGKYFNKTEMQQIIIKSNDFLPYLILKASRNVCEDFVNYLRILFMGNESLLHEFLNRKIWSTRIEIFKLIKGTGTFSDNIDLFFNLLNSLNE